MNHKHSCPHADNVKAADNSAQSAATNYTNFTSTLSIRQDFARLFYQVWRLAEAEPNVQRQIKHRLLAAKLFGVIASREVRR